jgi:hypothetical protein
MVKKVVTAGKKPPKGGKKKTLRAMLLSAGGHGDQRFPVHNDPTHEILCKWIDNRTQCREVPTGGNWNP